jgi:hypothetical protein
MPSLRAAAKQSRRRLTWLSLDCFVAALPRNDGSGQTKANPSRDAIDRVGKAAERYEPKEMASCRLSACVDSFGRRRRVGLFYNVSEDALTVTIGPILSTILMALWVDVDSKEHPEILRPFDYKFLVWVFLAPYLPYYLLKTRGAVGLLALVGFVALFALGTMIKLALYYLYWRPAEYS